MSFQKYNELGNGHGDAEKLSFIDIGSDDAGLPIYPPHYP